MDEVLTHEGSKRTIEDLSFRSEAIAKEKGWYDGAETDNRPCELHAALVHSEISEALEEFRQHRDLKDLLWEDPTDGELRLSPSPMVGWKPCGVLSEIADVVIRICQRAGRRDGPGLQGAMNRELSGRDLEGILPNSLPKLFARMHGYVSMAYLTQDN